MSQSSVIWSRDDISCCNEKSYKHVHCPCDACRGRATDRKTELRHWKEMNATLKFLNLSPCTQVSVPISKKKNEKCEEIDPENDEMIEQSEICADMEDMETDSRPDFEVDENPLKKLVCKAVFDALKIKHTSGASVKTFEEILQYGKKMLLASCDADLDRDILSTLWPKNWNDVQIILKEQGYEDVKEYFICFCHQEKEFTRDGKTKSKCVYDGKYSIMDKKEDKCPHCGNAGYIKYMYLGLESKVKNWFRNREMCQKMLAHWSEKDHWLENNHENHLPKKEIWDGKRWTELKWFWDPNSSWVLPTRCPQCGIPISAEHLIKSANMSVEGDIKIVECPCCFHHFEHCMEMANGSPLNLALIGHFDGWQPFGTSYRGSGSFEVTVANMAKAERNHIDEVYVLGFVPCFELPHIPNARDPFLESLMNELCEGFIKGFHVSYPRGIPVEGYKPSDKELVRLLLLCWTGDHPGQCEIGKFLNQGKCPCRRCKLIGQHLTNNSSNTHYYYGQNRFHYRYPWEQRVIESELNNLFDIENEPRTTVRKKLSSEKGFTGVAIFHKYLYPLCGFDILNHLVYDVYHTVPLNVVKNQLVRILDLEMIEKTRFDKQIANFPWTTEFKNGRIPKQLGNNNKGIGYWKAETFQKISFPMAECILESHLANPKEYEILSLVSRLTELHFHTGRNGWTSDMIDMHKRLAWRLNIKVEEVQGLHMCTISLHNLLHIHEDIINFSAPDNFWCAVFERSVKEYLKQTHNGKGIEATFAHTEAIREHLKSVEECSPKNIGNYNASVVSYIIIYTIFF